MIVNYYNKYGIEMGQIDKWQIPVSSQREKFRWISNRNTYISSWIKSICQKMLVRTSSSWSISFVFNSQEINTTKLFFTLLLIDHSSLQVQIKHTSYFLHTNSKIWNIWHIFQALSPNWYKKLSLENMHFSFIMHFDIINCFK